MEIEQSLEVPYAADAVWRCFHDTAAIVACLPGASLSGAPQDGRLPLAMNVKLGPIVASFAGDAQMQLDESVRAGSISGGGSDRKSGSRVKGSAHFSLHAAEPPAVGTRIDVRIDYTIAGSLAQFSRGGIVQELARGLTVAFRDNLKARLDAGQQAVAGHDAAQIAAPASPAPAAPPDNAASAEALDLGKLFWPLLWQRLRRLFGWPARQ